MISRSLAVALLVGGCLTAAAGGAYFAVRQNIAERPPAATSTPAVAPGEQPARPAPVSETEATVDSLDNGDATPIDAPAPPPAVAPPPAPPAARPNAPPRREPVRNARHDVPEAPRPVREISPPVPSTPSVEAGPMTEATALPWPEAEAAPAHEPPAPPEARYEPRYEPQYEEVIIPASAVIGLRLETALTSERSRVEDRVDARVTRDVRAEGRLAIPAGSRVIGTVTLVERGGKMKERPRLGVRFHTVVLAGGLHVPLRTEAIVREGDSPSAGSARKIGGAAAGGAILGAILGGGKGAAIGGAAGAGAGSAAVMAGQRSHATLPAGTTLTARLASPVVLELER